MHDSRWLQAMFLAAPLLLTAGCSGDAPAGAAVDAGAEPGDASLADTASDAGIDAGNDANADTAADTSVDATGDAGVDSASPADASSDAGTRCDRTKPFANVRLMAGLNDAGFANEGARLSPDELTAYFTRFPTEAGTTADVYVATRATRSSPFSGAAPLAGGNTADNDRWPTVTADGLFLYVWNGPKRNTLVASRASTAAAFSTFTIVPDLVVPTATSNEEPFVLGDHSAVYFAADATTGLGAFDLYRANRVSGGFQAPVPVPGVNSGYDELMPLVSADELTIYFASNRPGVAGRYDIYRATRANTSAAPNAVEVFTPLNSIGADFPSWVSTDDCVVLFTSDRLSGGAYSIFVAERGK